MIAVIVVMIYLLIITLNFLPRRKEHKKKENVLYIVILSISFCVLILHIFDVKIPTPSDPIRAAVEKLFMPSK